ncbi:MAG: nucleotidyltransferase domain-containing protein [Proteobacteria bacterium]|nr:nucleotidyltransferase domain-containing protein [Pseudomonadota bacterium]
MNLLLSSTQFARVQGLSAQRVRQLVAADKVVGAFRIGGRWVFPVDAEIRRTAAGRPPSTRAGILTRAARACDAALAAAGIRAVVIGSLAYGGVRAGSDLDLLILSYPGKSWAQVSAIATGAAEPFGVPVDVIFADTLPAAVKAAMLKDARRAGEL